MNGLVTYSVYGELFLFDVAGQGKKLDGPTKHIDGVQYVEAMKGLVTYGRDGELSLFVCSLTYTPRKRSEVARRWRSPGRRWRAARVGETA